MKTWKLITSALLVLVGFSAGVGLNFISLSSTVHGAPGTPVVTKPPVPSDPQHQDDGNSGGGSDHGGPGDSKPALKTVTHNATLTGDGTTAAPLGIANGGVGTVQIANGAVGTGQLANGGVSAPKLSTSATPSAGQVLGFNGANLAWQNASVGGIRLVDKFGKVLGPPYGSGYMLQVGNIIVLVKADRSGFVTGGFYPVFFYTTPDCSGLRYFLQESSDLIRNSTNTSSFVYYTTDPIQQITLYSRQDLNPSGADPIQPGPCSALSPPVTRSAGMVTTFDLNTLGLTPPFHLEF